MDTAIVANEIKKYLVKLASKDKLPIDLNELDIIPIDKILRKGLKDAEGTPLEQAFKKAGEYLCEGDMPIPHQISNIANYTPQDCLIDYVDGVEVWEKVELEFTCEQFLDLIGYPKKG